MKTKTWALLFVALSAPALAETPPPEVPRLTLERRVDAESGAVSEHGIFTVWENRVARAGRTLDLKVVILRALADEPQPDPMFIFAGGPGAPAAEGWQGATDHWMRRDRDIVLLSQRGTGGTNRLDCDAPGGADNVQGYLDQVFASPEAFLDCLDDLQARADLRWYGTATAMDDVDELRKALGYDRINLAGASYGTRAAMEYIRRHGEHVRCAILSGVAPVGLINPLFHASAAQDALDIILDECAADPNCSAAFPGLPLKLKKTLERLQDAPARVEVLDAATGLPVEIVLTRDAFAEALRLLMYYDSRHIPYLVERSFTGDFATFANAALESNRMVRDIIAFGMLLCVTCNEDIPRIDPGTIDGLTAGTFLGDIRVRQQMAICSLWPESQVPDDHGAPLRANTPVLMFSGQYDPVTRPMFAEVAARHLPNALHIVAPGSHGVGGPCIDAIEKAFLERGTGEGIDVSCIDAMTAGPFRLDAPPPPDK